MNRVILFVIISLSICACHKIEKKDKEGPYEQEQSPSEKSGIYGNYVDTGYEQRADGFDWVAVQVRQGDNETIDVSVRSRADKKRPTCTFDALAYKRDKNTYEAVYNGKRIVFEFNDTRITISTVDPNDINVLNFFCNGGASLGGTYKKIDGALDRNQIDLTTFSKVLNLQGIGFNVSSIEKNDTNTLTIFTFGLEKRDYNETFNIEGEAVVNAEVEDLNSDGSPELFVYTKTLDSSAYGRVYAFSVNNKKSMSQVYFKPTSENDNINEGYNGQDSFSVVENSFMQRFPIYKKEDNKTIPTGKIRQVSYKLVEGEAMRQLKVDGMTEYETNYN